MVALLVLRRAKDEVELGPKVAQRITQLSSLKILLNLFAVDVVVTLSSTG